MELLKTYIRNTGGFSLIEIVMVIAIFSVLFSAVSIVDISIFQKRTVQDELQDIFYVLMKTKSVSMNSICTSSVCTQGNKHGIVFDQGTYIIFEGDTFISRDPNRDEVYILEHGVFPNRREIIFESRSGKTASISVLYRPFQGAETTISLSEEGVILISL